MDCGVQTSLVRDLTSHLLPGGAHTAPHGTPRSSVVWRSQDWADVRGDDMEQLHEPPSEDSQGDRPGDKAKPPQSQRTVAFDLSSPGEDKQEEKTRRVTIR